MALAGLLGSKAIHIAEYPNPGVVIASDVMAKKNANRLNKGHGHSIVHPYLLLLLILIFAELMTRLFFNGPSGIDGIDNYIYGNVGYAMLTPTRDFFMGLNEFGSKFITFGMVALSFIVFGPSTFSLNLPFNISFLLTIVAIYFIGRELYDDSAGLVSALAYSLIPLASFYGANVTDDIPMALFTALTFLFLIMAYKRNSKRYAFLSGLFVLLGVMTTIEAVILMVPIAIVFLSLACKNLANTLRLSLFFATGVLLGVALFLAITFLETGNPLYYLTSAIACYSLLIPHCCVTGVDGWANLNNYLPLLLPGELSKFGFFLMGYAALVFSIYLLLLRKKVVILPLVWLAASFIYLCFGTISLHSYTYLNTNPRFLLLICPPMALVIGFGLRSILGENKGRSRMRLLAFALVLALLATTSVFQIINADYAQYRQVFPLIETASFINQLPRNASMYVLTTVPFSIYMGFRIYPDADPGIRYASSSDCSSFPSGSYFVAYSNASLASSCGLSVAFSAKTPAWLDAYTINGGRFTDFDSVVLYNKR